MAQAFDIDNNPLGKMEHGRTLKEAFDKAFERNQEAHSIMVSKISIPTKQKPNLAVRRAVKVAILSSG